MEEKKTGQYEQLINDLKLVKRLIEYEKRKLQRIANKMELAHDRKSISPWVYLYLTDIEALYRGCCRDSKGIEHIIQILQDNLQNLESDENE